VTRGDLVVGTAGGWDDLAFGTTGKALYRDGNDPSWGASGANTQVIFNDSGALAGDANLTWTKGTHVLRIA